jgi:hypothetical protein
MSEVYKIDIEARGEISLATNVLCLNGIECHGVIAVEIRACMLRQYQHSSSFVSCYSTIAARIVVVVREPHRRQWWLASRVYLQLLQ